ncbi:hypothetical protein K466DRAFT_393593 [Polyporus arcularius HHB13444]|uniref:Uncharacterized protein n=1 Tax=Polyporus arcularius HHB13444 TaxID=1314778 RepID=A0A5C3NUU7_9APHY|nr:hypothetical protein K466DRAFT_393593 [Polyporus arcularius HHB13444]
MASMASSISSRQVAYIIIQFDLAPQMSRCRLQYRCTVNVHFARHPLISSTAFQTLVNLVYLVFALVLLRFRSLAPISSIF